MRTNHFLEIYSVNNDNQPFDAVEIHPCKIVGNDEKNGKDIVEQCEPDEEDFWGVYIHVPDMGLECIADAATREDAEALANLLMYAGKNFHRDPNDIEI